MHDNVRMSNPHDALFKAVFGAPAAARAYLSALLPPNVSDSIDWSTLVRVDAETIDGRLRARRGDLQFEAQPLGGEALAEATSVLIQVEHQSRPDLRMSERMLRYASRRVDSSTSDRGVPGRPAVLSVVVYNGTTRWHPTSIGHFGSLAAGKAERWLLSVPIVFHDLGNPASLAPFAGTVRLALEALRFGPRRELEIVSEMSGAFQGLAEWPSEISDLHAFDAAINYLMTVRPEVPSDDWQILADLLTPTLRQMTLDFRTRMVEHGRLIGREEGRNEGRAETVTHFLNELARRGVDLDVLADVAGLDIETVRERIADESGD